MDLLFERMPRLARFMMLGILCMFIAPFGMLLAKWATLVSFADTGQVALIVLLAFGSAATFMFWAKWLGKMCIRDSWSFLVALIGSIILIAVINLLTGKRA